MGCGGITEASAKGGAGLGVCAQGATSPSSRVTAGLTSVRTGCGPRVGLSEDEGANCGLAKGNGGLLDTLGCLSVLGLTGDAGRRVSITQGAVAPVIEVVAGLAGMGASLGDACVCARYAVCDGVSCGSLTRPFAVEGHALVGSVGSQGAAFVDVVRTGSIATSLGTGLMGVGAVEFLGTTGLRPRTSSTSAAQSNRAGSCSIASNAGQAVGDEAGSRTSLCVSSACFSCSVSNSSSSASFPSRSSSISTVGSLLSRCSIAVFEFAVVVGIDVDEVIMWRAVAMRSSRSGVVVVSWKAEAAVLAGARMGVVMVVVSRETVVAASGCLVVIGIVFWISSSILGEAWSHFTRKCKARVDQEVTAAGEFFSRFSYQSSASESDLQ